MTTARVHSNNSRYNIGSLSAAKIAEVKQGIFLSGEGPNYLSAKVIARIGIVAEKRSPRRKSMDIWQALFCHAHRGTHKKRRDFFPLGLSNQRHGKWMNTGAIGGKLPIWHQFFGLS
jgi:hypothetical protein